MIFSGFHKTIAQFFLIIVLTLFSVNFSPSNNAVYAENTVPQDLLIVYIDPSSPEYQNLGTVDDYLMTGNSSDMAVQIRFVALVDGVVVKLERVSFNHDYSYLEVTEEIFIAETNPAIVYAFDSIVAETIPQFQLVAEYNGLRCVWPIQDDLAYGNTVFTLVGQPSQQVIPLDETSNMIHICRAYAISFYELYYKSGPYIVPDKVSNDELWQTVSTAITINNLYNTQDINNIVVQNNILNSYAKAMFPDVQKLPPLDTNYIKYNSNNGTYNVTPHFPPVAWQLVYCSENEIPGIGKVWTVAIAIEDVENGKQPITFVVYLKANEKQTQNNPFDYHITGIAELGGNTP